MIILYYDVSNTLPEEIEATYRFLKQNTKEEILAVPNKYEVLLNCSLWHLKNIRDQITQIIDQKEREGNR